MKTKIVVFITVLLLLAGVAYAIQQGGSGSNNNEIFPGNISIVGAGSGTVIGSYTRNKELDAVSASLGPSAPSLTTLGTGLCLIYDANAKLSHFDWHVPNDYADLAGSDVTFTIKWYPTAGDAVGNGETVIPTIEYRSLVDGETYDQGNATTATGLLTGGGSEVDKGQYSTTITLDADDTDNPINAGDLVLIKYYRDVDTDTYSGNQQACHFMITFPSVGLAQH